MIFFQVLTWGAAGTRLWPYNTPQTCLQPGLPLKLVFSSAEICREGDHCQAQIKYWWLYRYGVEKDSEAQGDAFMHEMGEDSGDKEHAVFNNQAE